MEKQVFRSPWWIVFASILSLIVGAGAIMVFATGVFLKPVAQEFGFGRGVISSAMALANVVSGIMVPVFGFLLDRYGIRRVLLPAIVLFAIATASLSFITASVSSLMILFALQGLVGPSQTPTAYSKVISSRFDEQRGLALGIALCGVGLGIVLVPQYARILLQHFGWRSGYIGLGVALILLAFIPAAIFFGEPQDQKRARAAAAEKGGASAGLPGMTFSEAIRMKNYWAILATVFFGMTAINGTLMHLVPMLTDRGISMTAATATLSASGMALIIGRLIAGYVLDKIFAVYIAIFFLIVPMLGIGIFASGAGGAAPYIGTVLLGCSVGAEFDLMAYIISRYFGLKSFGTLYGLMNMFLNFANAAGGALLGWCFQLKHSYTPMFLVFEVLLFIGIFLMAGLGPYRFPAVRRVPQKPAAVGTAN